MKPWFFSSWKTLLGAKDISSPMNGAIDGSVLPYSCQPTQLCLHAEIEIRAVYLLFSAHRVGFY